MTPWSAGPRTADAILYASPQIYFWINSSGRPSGAPRKKDISAPAFGFRRVVTAVEPYLEKAGKRVLLLGNEAIARGLLEGGVDACTGYPGTPSTEILETLIAAAPACGH